MRFDSLMYTCAVAACHYERCWERRAYWRSLSQSFIYTCKVRIAPKK